ncbi:mitochondrial carrier protein [Aureococcus anophagefferens]|uniref:Mitochondrial carrier protein n=1 Tax=Aureococcus anophagefferens TaxID=44056 RepID=A0ABR1GAA1_AURAN
MATWTTRVRWVEDGLVLRVTEVELAVGGAAALHHVKAAVEATFAIPIDRQKLGPPSALAELASAARTSLDVEEAALAAEDEAAAADDAAAEARARADMEAMYAELHRREGEPAPPHRREGEPAPPHRREGESKWASDAVLLEDDEPPARAPRPRKRHQARRLDEARAADLPPLEDLRREAPADGYALDREPRVALDEEPVALDEDGYVVEPGDASDDDVLDLPIPGLPDDDDDDDGDADDGGGDPAPARYSRFVVRFSGSVPVVVVSEPTLEIDQAAVARELAAEHGFAPERARETAAAAVRVANLKRGPRPVEEKYVLWWADKYGAREALRLRLAGAGGSDVDVDPMARVARRVHLGGRNQVPRMRLVVDESPAGLRRIAEAEAMGREDGRAARHAAGRAANAAAETALLASEDPRGAGAFFDGDAFERRGDERARMAFEDEEGRVLGLAADDRARPPQGRRDDALGAGLTFQQKRRVVAHLPVCDQMRLFCASRRLARVWSWGRGAGGALGHDDDDVTFAAPKELEALRPVPVKQLVAGPHHSAVLDWRGRVYSWGFDACLNVRQSVSAASSAGATYAEDAGPARAGDTRVRAPARVADVFRGDLDLDDGADALRAPPPAVRHIAADSTSVVAVGRDGAEAKRLGGKRLDAQLDAMERYGDAAKAPPKPLDAVAVAAITCGVEHSVALERSGHVWTSVAATIYERFGIARHLGLASGDLDEVLEPVPLGRGGDPMAPGRVALEAATRVEDDAPTRSPVVFTWGLGPAVGRGREGFDRTLADGEDGRPTRVRDLEDVVWLGAGHSFTAALTFAGELYLWGDGDVLGRAAPRHRPARAAFPKGAKCVAAACGLYHVLAMTCARDADAPVNTAFYLDHRVDASEWLLHSRIRTDAYGAIAPLTHARRGVRVPDVLRDLGPVELAVGHAAAEGGE